MEQGTDGARVVIPYRARVAQREALREVADRETEHVGRTVTLSRATEMVVGLGLDLYRAQEGRLGARIDDLARATGRPRHRVIEDALRIGLRASRPKSSTP